MFERLIVKKDQFLIKDSATSVKADEGSRLRRSRWYATAGIVLSRMSGLVRSQVINAVFGASPFLDAYWLAQRLPSSLRDLFAEGALSAAFTKTLIEARSQGPQAEKEFIAQCQGFFAIVTLMIAVAFCFFSHQVIAAMTDAHFHADSLRVAPLLLCIMAFYLPVAMLSSLAMAVLGSLQLTFRATIASAFFNVGSIAGAVLLGPFFVWMGFHAVVGLAVGTLCGGILQWVYQLPPLVARGLWPWPQWGFAHGGLTPLVRQVVGLMLPRVLGQGAMTMALLVNTHFTTELGVGALTYITNATTLILVPIGLFGVAAGFSSLPFLADAAHKKDSQRFTSLLEKTAFPTLGLSLASSLVMAAGAFPCCLILFAHGRFTKADAFQTALALAAYAPGIVFNSIGKVTTQALTALGDSKRLSFLAFVYLGLNVFLSWQLSRYWGIVGLGFSNSISAFFHCFFSQLFVNRLARQHWGPEVAPFALLRYRGWQWNMLFTGGALLAFLVGGGSVFFYREFFSVSLP